MWIGGGVRDMGPFKGISYQINRNIRDVMGHNNVKSILIYIMGGVWKGGVWAYDKRTFSKHLQRMWAPSGVSHHILTGG